MEGIPCAHLAPDGVNHMTVAELICWLFTFEPEHFVVGLKDIYVVLGKYPE